MKPAYELPSMALLRSRDASFLNGYRVVSTFSGCGGSCLGFRWAGFSVLWANEFVPAARETYLANFPDVYVDDRSIRDVNARELLELLGLDRGELDLLEGSPPCASFSSAGKRHKHWGEVKPYSDVEQRTDDLFEHYARFVEDLQPKVFVAENVPGLRKGVALGTFRRIFRLLEAAGYRVACRELDAQWLGVPQVRRRLVFVGVRVDLQRVDGAPVFPAFPAPLPYRYSIAEAIPGLNSVVGGKYAPFDGKGKDVPLDAPAPSIVAGVHGGGPHQFEVESVGRRVGLTESVPENVGASLEGYAIGREYDGLAPGRSSDRYFNLVRPDPALPLPTVTAMGVGGHNGIGSPGGVAAVCHPTEKRKFSIAELRRLCGFPDDFVLTGTYKQQWERLGRAVPPPMMFEVARVLRDEVLTRIDR